MTVKKQKIEVEVTKETHEIGVAIKKVITSYKEAVADGFQAGADIPAVLMDSYQDLLKAFNGAELVDDEFKGAPMDAAIGMLIPLAEGVEILMEKKESAE